MVLRMGEWLCFDSLFGLVTGKWFLMVILKAILVSWWFYSGGQGCGIGVFVVWSGFWRWSFRWFLIEIG